MCHYIRFEGAASDVVQLPFATPVVGKHKIACAPDAVSRLLIQYDNF